MKDKVRIRAEFSITYDTSLDEFKQLLRDMESDLFSLSDDEDSDYLNFNMVSFLNSLQHVSVSVTLIGGSDLTPKSLSNEFADIKGVSLMTCTIMREFNGIHQC